MGIVALNLVVLAFFAFTAVVVVCVADDWRLPPVAEVTHTQYDDLLGWANVPNLAVPDMYGSGIELSTDSSGFRRTDHSNQSTAGRVTVICSGDSFTLGYGVADLATWCSRLAQGNPTFRTLNMGQGGYGFDQAYLWYVRDGSQLEHSLHIFAFVPWDFERMKYTTFLSYGKPRLRLRSGRISVENVPVPRRPFLFPWVARSETFVRTGWEGIFAVRLGWEPAPSGLTDREVSDLVDAVVADLSLSASECERSLVFVALPNQANAAMAAAWRRTIQGAAAAHHTTFIDLTAVFEDADSRTMYIQPGEVQYRGSAGHYTARGNDRVASELLKRLNVVFANVTSPESRTARFDCRMPKGLDIARN